MSTQVSKKQIWIILAGAAAALLMAVAGFFSARAENGGAVIYFFESILPAIVFVALLWVGISLYRENERGA